MRRHRPSRLALICAVGCLGLAATASTNAAPPSASPVPASIRQTAEGTHIRTTADILGAEGLPDLDGRIWRAEQLRGRIVLVDAWATWCAPCLVELPRLRALGGRHAGELVVLGLNLDTMPRRDFESWLRRQNVGWPQVHDGRGYGSPVAQRLGLDALPASWLFDARGRLAATNLRGPALDDAVDSLVEAERK